MKCFVQATRTKGLALPQGKEKEGKKGTMYDALKSKLKNFALFMKPRYWVKWLDIFIKENGAANIDKEIQLLRGARGANDNCLDESKESIQSIHFIFTPQSPKQARKHYQHEEWGGGRYRLYEHEQYFSFLTTS